MTVYYVADEEKPKSTGNVRFFTDHASALSYASETRCSVFKFEVNDKCETDSFGLDTIMVFTKNDNGELKFMASGRWLEIHDIMNIPFYYDFEARGDKLVSMSQRYFLQHYTIKQKTKSAVSSDNKSGSENKSEISLDVIDTLFGGK